MVNRIVWLANILAIASASPILDARAAFARAGISLVARDTVTTLTAGDSVDKIATAAGVQLTDIANANSGVNLATVTPGQVLTIPSAPTAVVSGTPAAGSASSAAAPVTTTAAAAATVTPLAAAVTGAAAVPSLALTAGGSAATNPDVYTFFKGDGSKAAGWPTSDQWINYNDMFARNVKVMGTGCVNNVTPNTPAENDAINAAIVSVATAAQIDPRFVLASVMQESNGCVRVEGTPSGEAGVFNPGLMQSFKGTGTCNVNNTQEVNPCGANEITQMLVDGTQGTLQAGTLQGGLVQHMNDVGGDVTGQTYYKAAREYNSGAVSPDGVLETAGQCGPPRTFGVPCYSSDIANRLMGWVSAPTACTLQPAASC